MLAFFTAKSRCPRQRLRRKKSSHHRPFVRFPLLLEPLEDRLAPAIVDLGPLRFSGDFSQTGDMYSASGTIELGLKPETGDTLTSLLEINGSVSFSTAASNSEFLFDVSGSVRAVSSAQVPLLDNLMNMQWNGSQLVDASQGFDVSGTQIITVANVNFTPNNIVLVNTGSSPSDATVQLRGDLQIPDLIGLTIAIDGDNYVTVDQNSVQLTDFTTTVTTTTTVFSMSLSPGTISLNYFNNSQQFSMWGEVVVSSADNGISNVNASMGTEDNPGLVVQSGAVQQVTLSISENFQIFNLKVDPADSVTLEYTDGTQFVGYGDLTVNLTDLVIGDLDSSLGDSTSPGLTINNGQIQTADISSSGTLAFLGFVFQISNANFALESPNVYEMTGSFSLPWLFGATATLPAGSGLKIDHGVPKLDGFEISLEDILLGAFVLTKISVGFSDSNGELDIFASGSLWFPGEFVIEANFELDNGVLNSIGFDYTSTSPDGGIPIGDTGIFITGFGGEVQNLEHPKDLIVTAEVTLTYGGQLMVNFFGDKQEATMVKVIGSVTADRHMFVADVEVYLGAVTTFTGTNGLLGSGGGRLSLDWGTQEYSVDFDLSYYDGVLKGEVDVNIHGKGDALGVLASLDVDVPDVVPFIGGDTIGSMDAALLYHKDDDANSLAAAWASIDLIIHTFDIGFKWPFDSDHPSVIGNSEVDSIKHGASMPHPNTFQYFASFAVPEGATHGTFSATWDDVGGSQTISIFPMGASGPIDEEHFSTENGMSLVPQLSNSNTKTVHVVGKAGDEDVPLPTSEYQVIITSNVQLHSMPKFTGTFGYTRPTITLGQIPSDLTPATVQIPVSATVETSFAQQTTVTLYVDSDNQDYDGRVVRTATNVPFSNDPNWSLTLDLEGLLPQEYYLYAVINDGFNKPVKSAYAGPFIPAPPISGTVEDPMHGNVLKGIRVYLDLNSNGKFDAGSDPSTVTSAQGQYVFWGLQPGTYNVAVIVPPGFELNESTPNPTQVTFNGTAVANVDFALNELASINGTVFQDLNLDRRFDIGDPGLPGVIVYIDANGNGQMDDGEVRTQTNTLGEYSLYNLTPNTTYIVGLAPDVKYFQTYPVPVPNGTFTVTVGDDPYELISDINFGALATSTLSGTIQGYPLVSTGLSSTETPLGGWTVRLDFDDAINVGGDRAGDFAKDHGFVGGRIAPVTTAAIDTSKVDNPAPQKVYQTNRFDPTFSFLRQGLTPNGQYTVRLHFAETFWTAANQRIFDVAINGQTVLDDFDIFAEAGGQNIALVRTFTVQADAQGNIIVDFTTSKDNAQINGIEIEGFLATTTTASDGTYSFTGLHPANYQIHEEVPAGWREIAPFDTKFQFADPILVPNGSPPVPSNSIAVSDFNGDGHLDFATPWQTVDQGGLNIFFGAGDGTFPHFTSVIADFRDIYQVLVMDFLGNGPVDLAVISNDGDIDIFASNGDGTFEEFKFVWVPPPNITLLHPTRSYNVIAGEYVDGTKDSLLMTFIDSSGKEGYGIAIGGVEDVSARPLTIGGGVAAGDVNNDGHLDFFVAGNTSTGQVPFSGSAIAYGDGKGNFTFVPIMTSDSLFGPTALGDINGDGLLDAAGGLIEGAPGNISLLVNYYLQQPTGEFKWFGFPGLLTGPTAIAPPALYIRDVNGDLKSDLVWVIPGEGDGSSGGVYVNLNTGRLNDYYNPDPDYHFQGTPSTVALADVNADGLLDLLVPDTENTSTAIYLNTTVQNQTGYSVTVAPQQSISGLNFTNAQLGQISGNVFHDVNRSGLKQVGEPGLENVSVYIDLNRNSQHDDGEPLTLTNAHGAYSFTELTPGTYRVGILPPEGHRLTSPDGEFHEVTVLDEPLIGIDFGSAPLLLQPVDDQQVDEGSQLSLTVQPVSTDPHHGLIFELVDAPAGATIDARSGVFSWTAIDGPEQFEVTVRARNPLEPLQTETVSFRISVDNVAPVIDSFEVQGPDIVNASGFRFTAQGSFHDPGVEDLHTAIIDWGDGSSPQMVPVQYLNGVGSLSANHFYQQSGTFTVTLTITDTDGASTSVQRTVRTQGVWLDNGTLHIVGTPGNDQVYVWNRGSSLQVYTSFAAAGQSFQNFSTAEVTDLRVSLLDGDDRVQLLNGVAIPATLLGGAGNDYLSGDRGHDVLDGGPGRDTLLGNDGNDVLVGADGDDQLSGGNGDDKLEGGPGTDLLRGDAGNDFLHGGLGNDNLFGGMGDDFLRGDAGNDMLQGEAGNDILVGGDGQDYLIDNSGKNLLIGGLGADYLLATQALDSILIGGTTLHESDDEALQAILAEWTSDRPYEVRVQNLTDGTGSPDRLNGSAFLTGETVLNDNAVDYLFGSMGSDWLFPFAGDFTRDRNGSRWW